VARRLFALAALTVFAAGCGGAAAKPPPNRPFPTLELIGSLPRAISKAAAVALPDGKVMILGGLVGNTSIDTILVGKPNKSRVDGHLRVAGRLPQPTHDAAAALVGGSVYLFGGGSSVSTPDVVRVDPRTAAARAAPGIGEPLSDLGAVTVGGKPYLVGGFTGSEFATAILRYTPSGTTVVARLPQGTRYAGVAALGRTIYVAGGLTTSGPTSAIYAFTLGKKLRRIGSLPKPQAHAALAAAFGRLYYIGGRKILAINPRTGTSRTIFHLTRPLSDPSVATVGKVVIIAGGGTKDILLLTPRYVAPPYDPYSGD
jgi:hypothetical protein